MKIVKFLPALIVLVFLGIVTFGATAFAATAATGTADSSSLLDLLKPVFDAFNGGHYAFAAALLVVALVALVKRCFGDKVPVLHSDAGGSLLAPVTAAAAALATGLGAPGAHVTTDLLKSALLVGAGAAGGYAVIKNLLIDPVLKPLAAKAPAWAQPIFALVFYFFDKPDPIATATKAGDAAVAAKPAEGVTQATGTKITELK
jgi:hypothetical protein